MEEFSIKRKEFVNKTFRFPVAFAEKLSKVAQEQQISMTEFVIQSCEYAMRNMKQDD